MPRYAPLNRHPMRAFAPAHIRPPALNRNLPHRTSLDFKTKTFPKMQSAAGDAARSARITTELSKTLGRIQLDASELVLLYGYVNTKQQLTLHDFIAADAEKLRDRAAFEKFLLEQAAHRCGGSELCGVYVRKEVEVESGAIVDALREDWFSEFFEFLLNGECVVVVGGEDGVEEVWKVAGGWLRGGGVVGKGRKWVIGGGRWEKWI